MGPQPAQAPPRCTNCNKPPSNSQCTNPFQCRNPLLCSFNVPFEELRGKVVLNAILFNTLRILHVFTELYIRTANIAIGWYTVRLL